MSHFAKIEKGIVTQVIVAEQDYIDTLPETETWVQTSYNTYGNQHPEGCPLRGNYAGVGFTYDAVNDVFYAPQPFMAWALNTGTWLWSAPFPFPSDAGTGTPPKIYAWDESVGNWKLQQ
jgi:hypothetical protein